MMNIKNGNGLYFNCLFSLLLISGIIVPGKTLAESGADTAKRKLYSAGVDEKEIQSNPGTNYVRSFSTKHPIKLPAGRADFRAKMFLNRHAKSIGHSLLISGLKLQKVVEDDRVDMAHARYQQTIGGVPVTGSFIHIHMKGRGVSSMSSSVISKDMSGFNVNPSLTKQVALETAKVLIEEVYNRSFDSPTFSRPTLEVFNFKVLDSAAQDDSSTLVWFIEARAEGMWEWIWVDATNGNVHHHFSKVINARNRLTYDSENTAQLRRSLIRSEVIGPRANLVANDAHDFARDFYDYFFIRHARDSYDDMGGRLISNVNNTRFQFNAFWDGIESAYSPGFVTDDIVAHEFTHGLVQESAGLLSMGQSGALNESYSDIFGEIVDMTNSAGNDTPEVRWLLGEDNEAVGVLRSLKSPGMFNDPAKISDPNYDCFDNGSRGQVHKNGGVNNNGFVLATEGGEFNGASISGIGLAKAERIYYRALTVYLGPTSTYQDNYRAILASCADLIGVDGITTQNCEEVNSALDAVEMNIPICTAPFVADCPANQTRQGTLLFDDFENVNSGLWIRNTLLGSSSAWSLCNISKNPGSIYCSGNSFSGSFGLNGVNLFRLGDEAVEMANSITLPSNTRLRFMHQFGFNAGDGGVIEYSIDEGITWQDAESFIESGQEYDAILDEEGGVNPLAQRGVFGGLLNIYSPTILDLTSLVGESFRLRFRLGTDDIIAPSRGEIGRWRIDDVSMYQCVAECTNYLIKTRNEKFVSFCL